MTMGHFTRNYFPLFTVTFLLILSNWMVLGVNAPHIYDILATGEIGHNATVYCNSEFTNTTIDFKFNGELINNSSRYTIMQKTDLINTDSDGNKNMSLITNLTIANVTSEDAGNYSCIAKSQNKTNEVITMLDLNFAGKLVEKTLTPLRKNISELATLKCIFEMYGETPMKWWKCETNGELTYQLSKNTTRIGLKQVESSFDLSVKKSDDNTAYICEMYDSYTKANISGEITIHVLDKPQIQLHTVKAIGAHMLFLNWTVYNHHLNITRYDVKYRISKEDGFIFYPHKVGAENTSFVMTGLKNSTNYEVRIEVYSEYGSGQSAILTNKTLEKDPIFVPNITINGFSATSVTIGWAPPPEDIAEFIHYYELEARKQNETEIKIAYHPRDGRNLPYMFDDLEPYTMYTFRVQACSEYTRTCGNWSDKNVAMTLDGIPGRPSKVAVYCYETDLNNRNMNVTWEPPMKPNAEIKGYALELTGNSTYIDQTGNEKVDTWGPLSKFVINTSRSVRFDELKPNTNYTVKLSAMTRTRRRGDEEVRHCQTAPGPPEQMPQPRWRKVLEANRYIFKTLLPRVSERNGPICCYRVYMVRMLQNQELKELPSPSEISIISYEEAHSMDPTSGAYITDILSNKNFPTASELTMGDEVSINDTDVCSRCLREPVRVYVPPSTIATTTKEEYDELEAITNVENLSETNDRKRRSHRSNSFDYQPINHKLLKGYFNNIDRWPMMKDSPEVVRKEIIRVYDGLLDPAANYTLFVELIPGDDNDDPLYSMYLNILQPAPNPPVMRPINVLEIALQVTCGLLAVVLLSMIIFCVLHMRRTRKVPPDTVELNSLQATLRSFYQSLKGGRHQLVSSAPPDMPPIAKEDLAEAYSERQADSDYGFQREFEMLPDCFPERTCHASEARENQPKNRYPDIKAYDQTRVKLSQIDSIVGSDYINANYVMGYKERKKFICAQGPTETTVNDFWRMIWEHGLELIVMLTNLEEYSKVKCSKYWPDEVRGSKAFGNITVHHVSEKRYSDYIVRELKITKQPTTAEGQPIVENNGFAKRNGDIKDSPSSSAPTSPRDTTKDNGTANAERTVRQYHFLMWKDFAAPEHPHSILKFIKRVNSAWSQSLSRPAVVHCSAGVGRTGTLVALDWLLHQLRAEGQVSVFNTVAELRRQRNFLVQSLKQYVFVYRALVEYAHYGDTEIPASKLKSSVDRLRNTPEGADKCLMEEEFEKLLTPPVAEPIKSCSAGASEEVAARNRSPDSLPYDRNRVILTPLPTREFSTYINASFIEAYDNSEGFIITQDPLPGTISDFWRMVSEHNVATIVMLSELGEGDRKCPRYWDDGTATYDTMSVHYEQSESCPYYTRREFRVTNNRNGETSSVRQLQYHGWPTVAGQVPEVTRGLADVADAALAPPPAPTLVHCHTGTERAGMFVALCVAIGQLRAERRADVSCVARKVRAQRAHTIDTFLQYEFLHRAILNYAELHNLLDDS